MSFPHTSAATADADVAGAGAAGAADAPDHGSSTLPNSNAAATNSTTPQSKHDAKETETETSQESGSADKVNSQRTATLPIRTAAAAADHDRDRDPEDGHLIPQSDEKKDNVAKDYRLHATALSYKDFAQPSQSASSTAGVTSTRSSHDAAGDNGNSGQSDDPSSNTNQPSTPRPMISEWSHQAVLLPGPQEDTKKDQKDFFEDDEGWQAMPALGPLDHYDDHGRLVAKAGGEEEDDEAVYQGLGGAGKGYTRVQLDDDDARSATSLEDDTGYLFKEPQSNALGIDNDDDPRDPLSQLQTTKDLLTEGQRIAYVGVTRLMIFHMVQELQKLDYTRSTKKYVAEAIDGLVIAN
ncbi:hypothetical protein KEM55_000012 [Ascosphaera atra]|nr:hypothetical protein KEM55_000012 [Ascosphaera atra]